MGSHRLAEQSDAQLIPLALQQCPTYQPWGWWDRDAPALGWEGTPHTTPDSPLRVLEQGTPSCLPREPACTRKQLCAGSPARS